jgi:hypothetical protein
VLRATVFILLRRRDLPFCPVPFILSYYGPDTLFQFISRQGPYCLVRYCAISVKEYGRNTPHIVSGRQIRVIIHVDFYQFGLPFKRLRQFIQNWFEIAAMPSPGREEFDQNRPLEIHDFLLKGRFRDI